MSWLSPVISPRRFRDQAAFVLLMLATQALMLVVGVATLPSAVGYPVAMSKVGCSVPARCS
ncbi:MAG TPA: hypothetical protein VGN24_02470 [Rhodanobacter sp.]|nr:hypothetical protein [Rhodanobacter sp.]